MRILHVVHQYPPDFLAGTEIFTQMLARRQQDAGHSPAVFAPAPQGSPAPVLEDGVMVYRVPVGSRSRTQIFAHTFVHSNLKSAWTAVLAQENPDIIHIQHLMGLPFSLMEEVVRSGIPYFVTLHDYWFGCANGQLITNTDGTICTGPDRFYLNCGRCALARSGMSKLRWAAPAAAPIMAFRNGRLRSILTKAAKVIAPTRFVQETYRKMGLPVDNFLIFPHGLEIHEERLVQIVRGAEMAKGKRSSGTLAIGYVGSLAPQKGIHILIDAVNRLPDAGVTLTLFGSQDTFPEYAAQLRRSARHPGIRFAGRISRDDVWQALAVCDVIVLPTLWYESSPVVIDEAGAVRTPLIASRIGSLPEKIKEGVNGMLFPPGDTAALYHILNQLTQDRAQLNRLRQGIGPVRTMAQYVQELDDLYTAARHGRIPSPQST